MEEGKILPLVGGAHAWWTHQIREGQRNRELKKLVKRRPHLEGAQHGLAVDIITSLFRWRGTEKAPELTAIEKGTLQSILADSITTQRRRFMQGKEETDRCPHCAKHWEKKGELAPKEDQRHIWWECPAWEEIRKEHIEEHLIKPDEWDECWTNAGLMIVPQRLKEIQQEYLNQRTYYPKT